MPKATDLIGKKIRKIRDAMMKTFGPSDFKAKEYSASSSDDTIWQELSQLAEAILTLTAGGRGGGVSFQDMEESDALYVNSKEVPKQPGNQSIINKFTTLGAMIADPRWGDDAVVKFTAGSDNRNESLVIQDYKRIALYAESAPDVKSVYIGSVALAGEADQITLSGITLMGTYTLGSNGRKAVAINCTFNGNIIAVSSGLVTPWSLIRSWEKCCLTEDAIFNGEAVAEYGFYDCWGEQNEDGNYPTITINNPNATLILAGTTDLKMHINIVQAKRLIVACMGLIDIRTAGSVDVTLAFGGCWDPEDSTIYGPVTLNHTGKLIEGLFLFDRPTSMQGGAWIPGGIGGNNVRDNRIREGYNPVVIPLAGDPVRTIPNTITDHLNGIAIALVSLRAALVGMDIDFIDSPDGTKIQFVKKSDHTQVLYQMDKPQILQGSRSISVAGGIAQAILDPDTPIYDLIMTLIEGKADRPPDGMGYSSNDFTPALLSRVLAQAVIKSVTLENGQHLDADGILHQDDVWTAKIQRLYPVGTVYYTENPDLDTPEKIAEQFGFGVWERYAPGRSVVGFDETQTEFNEVGKIGGEKVHTLNISEMPSHAHNSTIAGNRDGNPDGGNDSGGGKQYWRYGTTTTATTSTGGGNAHNNLQPFRVAYTYIRIS